ncbi:hypothetical protein B7494_g7824 [Chlorociboria aeruginascens]|nr:hypothetical protein B7494_g7824 [Chlorociboria aeruginascens]
MGTGHWQLVVTVVKLKCQSVFDDESEVEKEARKAPQEKAPQDPCQIPYTKPRRNAPQRAGHSGAIATTELLLHSSEHPKLDYIAREEDADGPDALLKHYVGIYDSDTEKVEVMEVRKMVVRGSVRSQQASAEGEISTNIREQRNNLGQTFGTKKARKVINSYTENAITPARAERTTANGAPVKLDSVAAAMLASMAESTAGMASRDELAAKADAAKPRPKANLAATEVQNVYTIDTLIGLEIMTSIHVLQWEEALKAKKPIMFTTRYVPSKLQKHQTNTEKLKILKYMLCLINLYNVSKPTRDGRQLPRRDMVRTALDAPEAVIDSIKRKFTEGGVMNRFKCDLLITHLCAMACIIDNYEVDMYDLRQDLKLEARDMQKYFHEIGAKIVAMPEALKKQLGLDKAAAAQRKFARLKLPLDFPKVSFARKAR